MLQIIQMAKEVRASASQRTEHVEEMHLTPAAEK